MRFLRRIVAATFLLLATVGILCCAAGIVGIWLFHQAAYRKVMNVASRIDGGLQRASVANQKLRRALDQARTSVGEVKKESADLGGSRQTSRHATNTVRKLVRQQVAPDIKDIGVRLATLSDAATALASLLQTLQDVSLTPSSRIQPEKLEDWTNQAEQLSATLRRLERVVGDGEKESSGKDIAAATGAVDQALHRCQTRVEDWQSALEGVRQQLQDTQTTIIGWWTLAAILLTVLCTWLAISQISVFVHILQWW